MTPLPVSRRLWYSASWMPWSRIGWKPGCCRWRCRMDRPPRPGPADRWPPAWRCIPWRHAVGRALGGKAIRRPFSLTCSLCEASSRLDFHCRANGYAPSSRPPPISNTVSTASTCDMRRNVRRSRITSDTSNASSNDNVSYRRTGSCCAMGFLPTHAAIRGPGNRERRPTGPDGPYGAALRS